MSHTAQDASPALPESTFTPKAPRISQPPFNTEATPATHKYGPDLRYTSSPTTFLDVRDKLAKEMDDRWFGSMPVTDFLNKYLPVKKPSPSLPDDPFKNVPIDATESKFYDPFINAIERWIPHLSAVNTSTKPDTVNNVNLKTDISIYNQVNGVAPPDRTDFSRMELWMEFKANRNGAAFKDPEDEDDRLLAIKNRSFTPDTIEGRSARGQMAHYAGAQHSKQFRHYSFSIVVEKDHARFLRWEPGATVVTASFNYREEPHHMAEFLWRFDHLTPKERGHDVSIRPAELASDVDTCVREKLGMKKDVPLYQYEVPGLIKKGHAYGPRLPSDNRSLASRCTRSSRMVWIPRKDGTGLCGEDPWSLERVIYMKDTWRFISDKMIPEHEVYEILHNHRTPNIPEYVAGGDVDGGRTQAHKLLDATWLCVRPIISSFQHYRLIHGTVGRPLFKFECTRQLVSAVFDALQAHSHAVNFAKLLHRDISAGNIILAEDGRGLLIDWEMSKLMNDEGSRWPDRTGTWQFMAANLLQNPGKRHTVEDDLESFLHVLAWMTLRYVPAIDSYRSRQRSHDMRMFDQCLVYTGELDHGGDLKALLFEAGSYPSKKYKPQRETPLFKLMQELRKPFKFLYGDPPTDAEREKINGNIDKTDLDLNYLSCLININLYDQNMKLLRSSTWFIDTMKKSLDTQEWPADDKADESLPISFPGETERREENLASLRQRTQAIWEQSHARSSSLKRAGSPTPESSAKRRRATPAASGTTEGS